MTSLPKINTAADVHVAALSAAVNPAALAAAFRAATVAAGGKKVFWSSIASQLVAAGALDKRDLYCAGYNTSQKQWLTFEQQQIVESLRAAGADLRGFNADAADLQACTQANTNHDTIQDVVQTLKRLGKPLGWRYVVKSVLNLRQPALQPALVTTDIIPPKNERDEELFNLIDGAIEDGDITRKDVASAVAEVVAEHRQPFVSRVIQKLPIDGRKVYGISYVPQSF